MKRKWIIIIVVIVLLTLLNPTYNDFDHFIHAKGFDKSVHGGRTGYFCLLSIYEVNFNYGSNNEMKRHAIYIGFLKNFIKIYDTVP